MDWLDSLLLVVVGTTIAQAAPAEQNKLGSPPRPIVAARGLSDMDYPKEALRLRQEGLSIVTVHVNEKGRVQSCSVQQSSGALSLDDATCTFARSVRFAPARNGEGRAIEGDAPVRMNWRLPSR